MRTVDNGTGRVARGLSRAGVRLLRDIRDATRTEMCVLLTGDSARSLRVAETIHRASRRAAEPFVVISCDRGGAEGSPAEMLNLLMLRRSGAAAGTVLMHGVHALDAGEQARLVALLAALGLNHSGPSPRILASTTRDLAEEVQAGRFNRVLFYRLNVIHIVLPRGEPAPRKP